MGLESASNISELVDSNPDVEDDANTTDDHLRLIKTALQGSFPDLKVLYSGGLNEAGSEEAGFLFLPTGWTGSLSASGHYRVTHGLSSSAYVLIASAFSPSGNQVTVDPTLNSFVVYTFDLTATASSAFHFMLANY